MGQKFTPRNVVYYFFYVLQWVAGVSVAVLTFAASQDAEKRKDVWLAYQIILWSQQHKLLIFILAAAAVVAKFVCDKMGPPWAWKAIQKIIDFWQKQATAGMIAPSINEHRITLFKHTHKWRTLLKWPTFKGLTGKGLTGSPSIFRLRDWPAGWFKPIARSGHVNQKNISWFPSFDNARGYEGVIGLIWRRSGALQLPSLPDLDPPATPSAADFNSYSKQAKIPVGWLQNRTRTGKVNARSFYGTKIEIEGKNWGVIIIDSRNPILAVTNDQMGFAAVALGEFIKKA